MTEHLLTVDRGWPGKGNPKCICPFQWQLKSHLPRIQSELRLIDICGSSTGVKNVNTAFREGGGAAARQRLGGGGAIIRGLSLLIIGRSAERGEKPAASGPDGLCSVLGQADTAEQQRPGGPPHPPTPTGRAACTR